MNLLNDVIIQPLIEVYNILFTLLYGLIEDPVFSIMALSIAINFLVLPLYRKADQIQQEEIEKLKKMSYWLIYIRKHFSGDERFMMEAAYYKVKHYNPLSILKEAGPLFLQIPFFIAAYRYISSLQILERATFGPIQNLLLPDGLLMLAGQRINLLPIIMTVINCLSGYIYSRDSLTRQKVQIYGTAVLFLVLLYNSPSGLVLYWIMNNIFSLCKNYYYRYPAKDNRILPTVGAILLVYLVLLCVLRGSINSNMDVFISECIMVAAIFKITITALQLKQVKPPTLIKKIKGNIIVCEEKQLILQIILVELCLTLLLGFYIPSSIIVSSPNEFVNKTSGVFQYHLLEYPAAVYTGLFLIWMTVVILSREGKKRVTFSLVLWGFLGIALFNRFFVPIKTGTLYTDLSFDGDLSFSLGQIMINITLGLIVALLLIYIVLKKHRLSRWIAVVICISLLVLFMRNMWLIERKINDVQTKPLEIKTSSPIRLSKNGKNVVVMMLDRAIGGYVPYIFDEKPELKESFQGFVYYPNTISFGTHTNFGTPGLFGGYEYTPYESNKNNEKSLKEKQNEALKLMPILFQSNGYAVTVCDPPLAGYKETPDLSIYDDYPKIRAYNLSGKFSSEFTTMLKGDLEARQRHNFLLYSIFLTTPLFMKNMIYNDGNYLSGNIRTGFTQTLIDSYAVLWKLPLLTSIHNSDQDCFLMFQNMTPHNPTRLNPPDYAIDGNPVDYDYHYSSRVYDDKVLKIENDSQWNHYCINVATYETVATWLDYLKQEGVYDNTRIIIVADHGYYLEQFDNLIHPDGLDIESLNPLLMVKDFDSQGEFSIDNTFMTNADVPTLAMKDVISNPVNPFTGIAVDNSMKYENPLIVTDSDNWQINENDGTVFDLAGGNWWSVHDNIFDINNWEKLEEDAGR